MDYIVIIIPVIISIVLAIIFLSSLGMLSVLEKYNETTFLGIFWAIICVPIITVLAFIVYRMINTEMGEKIRAGTSGGIAGLILGALLLSFI